MFGKKENVEVKTEEKKKSKKKTILTVVVILFLFLAIAGSDDNQSTNTTVATSTNAVETENTDTNNNSVAEISDVSFTGMRFNKSWSELKPELEKYSPKWASDKSYYDKENITEHIMNYNSNTENAYQINFIVEDKTDKIIGMYLAFLKQINDKDRDKAMDMWENILGEFGKSVVDQQLELLDKLLNDETPVYFKDNKYMCITESNQYYLFYALASNEEEANYHKENGIWRKMKDQQTEKNPDVMDGITEEDYIANNQERTDGGESQEPTTKDNKTTENTDKKNTNSNSVVEVSNISPTGMRFKKTWSELKPQLDKYFANDTVEWKSTKLTEEFTEYNMIFRRYRNATYEENMSLGAAGAPVTSKVPFNAFYFTFTTENSSDKILGIDLVINDKYDKNSKEEENCFSVYGTILAMFDKSVCDAVGDFMLQIGNSTDNTIYYKDNLYVFDAYEAPWGHIALFPCDYENAQYHKEHKTWKKFNNN